MQIQRSAQQLQLSSPIAEHFSGSAGQMHRQHGCLCIHTAVHHGGINMATLMATCKARDAKHRSQTASLCIPHLKRRHIGAFIISWIPRGTYSRHTVTLDGLCHFLHPLRQLLGVDKHHLALPKASLSLRHRQQLPAGSNHLTSQGHRSDRGGVAAGIQSDDHILHHACASLSRRIVPRTPLINRLLLSGSEYRLASSTASLMATLPGTSCL